MFKGLKIKRNLEILLHNDNRSVVGKAACILGELGDKRAVEPLIAALGNRIAIWRQIEIVRVLTSLGDVRAVELLLTRLKEDYVYLNEKKEIIDAVAELGDSRGVDPLLKILDYYDPTYQDAAIAAAITLGKLGDQRAIEPLINSFSVNSRGVRRAVAVALGALGEPLWRSVVLGESMEADILALGKTRDPRVFEPLVRILAWNKFNKEAAEALGELGSVKATDKLVLILGSWLEDDRRTAAQALEKLGEPKWRKLIEGDVNDFSRLAESGDPRVFDALMRAVKEPADVIRHDEDEVRRVVVESLGKVDKTRAVDALIVGLTEWRNHGKYAAKALAQLCDRRAVEPLIKAASTSNERDLRISAIVALGKLGDPAALDPLVKAMTSEDAEARTSWAEDNVSSHAATALGMLGDLRAVEPLTDALRCTDFHVARRAAEALGKLGGQQAVNALVKAVASGKRDVVVAAAIALAHLHHPCAPDLLIELLESDSETCTQLFSGSMTALPLVDALGVTGDSRAIEFLAKMVNEENRDSKPKMAAIKALGKSANPRAVDPLIRKLGDEKDDVRTAAAAALEELGESSWKNIVLGSNFEEDFGRLCECDDSRAAQALRQVVLARCTPEITVRAARALLRIDLEGNYEFIVVQLFEIWDWVSPLGSTGKTLLFELAKALTKLSKPVNFEPFIAALGDTRAEVRCVSANALDILGRPEFKSIILGNEDDFERLGRFDNAEILPAILHVVHRRERAFLVEALARWPAPCVVEELFSLLSWSSGKVKCAAANSLYKLGLLKSADVVTGANPMEDLARLAECKDARAIIPWLWYSGQSEEEVEVKAVAILGELGDPVAVDDLISTYEKYRSWGFRCRKIRAEVAHALGLIKDARGVTPLIGMLGDEGYEVCEAAAKALGILEPKWKPLLKGNSSDWRRLCQVPDSRMIEPLVQALYNEEHSVREDAAKALAIIAKKRPELIGRRWLAIRLRASVPYHEAYCPYADDSSKYNYGIGVDFPNLPPDAICDQVGTRDN